MRATMVWNSLTRSSKRGLEFNAPPSWRQQSPGACGSYRLNAAGLERDVVVEIAAALVATAGRRTTLVEVVGGWLLLTAATAAAAATTAAVVTAATAHAATAAIEHLHL